MFCRLKACYLNPIGFAPISGMWSKVFVKALPYAAIHR